MVSGNFLPLAIELNTLKCQTVSSTAQKQIVTVQKTLQCVVS